MLVVMAIFTDSLITQRRQIKHLEQKQEILDLKNVLIQNFSTDSCTAQLKDLTFDGTAATLASQEISLPGNELRTGVNLTAPVIAKEGQSLPSSQTNIKVGAIKFKNLTPTGNVDEYKGVIEIQFDVTSLVQATKPLQIQKVVYAPETAAPTRKIANCVALENIPSTVAQNTKVFTVSDLASLTSSWNCYGGCNVQAVKSFTIPIVTKPNDQYISISAIGVWDLTKV